MAVKPIEPGDTSKQGNAVCPQCGAKVLITNHYGDPPKCGNCDVPYTPLPTPVKYT